MSFFDALVSNFRETIGQKLIIPYEKTVCDIGRNEDFVAIARRYVCHAELIPSFSDVSWSDILGRKIVFVRIPPKRLTTSFMDRWKRRFIRWNHLDISSDIYLCWLHDALWVDHGRKTLFTIGSHIAQIYSEHLPDFTVVQVSNGGDELLGEKVYKLAKQYQAHSADVNSGITVFANVTSLWFIRSYRLLHPKRKIILRFHDLIDSGLGMSRQEVFRFVDTVRKEGIVDDVESYDPDDARALKCKYRPNGVNSGFIARMDLPYRERLYGFIGTSGHGKAKDERLRGLDEISQVVEKLYPYTSEWCIAKNQDSLDGWLPYLEFVKVCASSEVYVDLYREKPNEGFSFRIPEALWLNRKIINATTI